jgi:hypothetical protein
MSTLSQQNITEAGAHADLPPKAKADLFLIVIFQIQTLLVKYM